ncbi:helix-turn-helix transcriptional regulator [Peterkaempfera bronchialis]|uniref:DNA-binding response regulator n=1 Tax=Peterkaempfera bronchialis TaxID=2126346 RepID=A0A345SU85_9ACTN|nr:response regulator transcription factor [Peterkaempfera bronchialis]AXI77290.1 DNA-binding response regulator [Peterkaempfera bronchialis]
MSDIQVYSNPVGSLARTSVLVVLESELVRCGVFNLLHNVPSVAQVWSCSGPVAARELLIEHRPDIVVCHGSGELAPGLIQEAEAFEARVLLLLEDLRLEAIDEVVLLSSHGFLIQSELTSASLCEALARLDRGEMPLPAGLARTLMVRVRGTAGFHSSRKVSLTPREQQVLSLLAEGLSNKQIARRLTISEHGVKRHVTNLLAKLNSPNRTLAVALALQEGLV